MVDGWLEEELGGTSLSLSTLDTHLGLRVAEVGTGLRRCWEAG